MTHWFETPLNCKTTTTAALATLSSHIITTSFLWWEHLSSSLLESLKCIVRAC